MVDTPVIATSKPNLNYNSSTNTITPPGQNPSGTKVDQTTIVPGVTPGTIGAPSTTSAITAPRSEDDIYHQYITQGQSIIDQINKSTQDQIAAANLNIDQNASKDQQNNNAISAITGNFGSASAVGASAIGDTATKNKNSTDAQIQATGIQAVTKYMTDLQATAQNQANIEEENYPAYQTDLQTKANSLITGLLKVNPNLSLATLQNSTDPTVQQTYKNLLQAYNNDPNAVSAAIANATPVGAVVQSWIQGSTFYQIVKNPATGAVSTQQFDLGVTVPTNWTTTKIGTTGQFFQDPSDPKNSFTLTTNPLTGGLSAQGTGTGQALADQYNQSQGSDTSGSSNPLNTPGTGASNASTTVATALGVDPTVPLSDVLSTSGLGSVVAAIIKNEGGSPTGVVNNPGNVKYVSGMPGATDSGVKASDGGTFASFKTPLDGQQAIADIVNGAASGTNSNYGTAPTLQDFVNKYTNSAPTGTGTNGLSTQQYGELANVQGFNPTKPGIDQDAFNYIQKFFSTGTIPAVSSFGRGTTAPAIYNAVQKRADDVYYKATGQHLPSADTLSKNLTLIGNNNQLLNNLKVQENTITKNFGLNLENVNENSINKTAPAVNGILNFLSEQAGSTSVAQYLSQNATLTQELGNLLALKNASGTTVADKLSASELLSSNLSANQQKAVINTLMKEAQNAKQGIGQATADLYEQTDPLGLNPQNPTNQPGYKELTGAGFTSNYDGTYTAPDGTQYSVDAQGNVTPVQ